jgi:hypothetical protein
LRDCVRFQVPTIRAPERCDWNEFIYLCCLETRPETRLGFPRTPVLSLQSNVRVIRHPAGLHARVTPRALDRSIHIHLQRKQLARRVRIISARGQPTPLDDILLSHNCCYQAITRFDLWSMSVTGILRQLRHGQLSKARRSCVLPAKGTRRTRLHSIGSLVETISCASRQWATEMHHLK